MITTDDAEVAERARLLRNHGMKVRYHHDLLGYNFRMSDIHAAIGIVQIDYLDEWNERRRAHAAYLNRQLRGVAVPSVPDGFSHVYHQYTVRVTDGGRDALLASLADAGVGTGVYYPIPAHKQRVYLDRGCDVSLPATEQACAEVLSLPVNPLLTAEDLQYIVEQVNTRQERAR